MRIALVILAAAALSMVTTIAKTEPADQLLPPAIANQLANKFDEDAIAGSAAHQDMEEIRNQMIAAYVYLGNHRDDRHAIDVAEQLRRELYAAQARYDAIMNKRTFLPPPELPSWQTRTNSH